LSEDNLIHGKSYLAHGKTSAFRLPGDASALLEVAINPDNVGCRTYQPTQPAQESISKNTWLVCDNAPLTRICNACEAGTRWVSRHGGLDPDVWPVRCDACDGTGTLVRECEGWLCHRPATMLVAFPDGASEPYCDTCAVEMRAEAEAEGGFW
jgi:hypothetical protein